MADKPHVYSTTVRFHTSMTDEVRIERGSGINYIDLVFAPHGQTDSRVELSLAIGSIDGVIELRNALDLYIAEQAIRGFAA